MYSSFSTQYAVSKVFKIAAYLFLIACSPYLFSQTTPASQSSTANNAGIYDILLAEISLRRGSSDQAAQLYLDQAISQNSVQLAAHAARIAQTIEAYKISFEASKLWLKLSPNNPEAISIQTIAQIHLYASAPDIQRSLESNIKNKNTSVFTHLALNSRQPEKQRMILNQFQILLEKHPSSHNLLLGSAYLNHQLGAQTLAETQINKALRIKRDIDSLMLNVEISEGSTKIKASNQLLSFLNKNIDDIYVQEQALNVLSNSDPKAALEILNKLIEQSSQPNLLLLLAKTNIQLDKLRNADIILQPLLLSPTYKAAAHYLLGLIKRKQDRPREAIPHFFLARDKEQLIPATEALVSTLIEIGEVSVGIDEFKHARSKARKPSEKLHLFLLEGSLYQQNNHYSAAIDTYNKALIFFPNNPELIYSRALIYLKFKQYTNAVSDLESLIKANPFYTPALNALAFHYADTQTNILLAEKLIDQALKIVPNEPLYIDTKGWIKYAQRDFIQAQSLLEKAYSQNNHSLIATHLIEILWAQAKLEESVAIWKKATAAHPENQALSSLLDDFRKNPERFSEQRLSKNPQQLDSHRTKEREKIKELFKTQPDEQIVISQTNNNEIEIAQISEVKKEIVQTHNDEKENISDLTSSPIAIEDILPTNPSTIVQTDEAPERVIATNIRVHDKTASDTQNIQQVKTNDPQPQPLVLASNNEHIPANKYAIQLISAKDLRKIQSFKATISSHLNPYIYQYTSNKETLHALILTPYISHKQAKQTLNRLPKTLTRHGPWIIKTNTVQERISSTTKTL